MVLKISVGLATIFILSNVGLVFASTDFEFSPNDIEWCHEAHPLYVKLGLDWFLENNHYSIEARVCGGLYEDPLWDYEGDDRMQKLLERSKHYIELEIAESKVEAETGVNDPTPAMIPSWIKTTAGYWVDEITSDDEFVNAIQFLINEEIIVVPPTNTGGESATEVPPWIKNTTGYWVDNRITDKEFVNALQWLIINGIIRVLKFFNFGNFPISYIESITT